MFIGSFLGSLLGSLLAIIAFILGLSARSRIKALTLRLRLAEEKIDGLDRDVRFLNTEIRNRTPKEDGPIFTRTSDQERVRPAVVQAETPPPTASEPPRPATPGSVPPIAARARGADAGEPPSPPPPVSQAPASGSFEERLGTRWAVWAGGAALALGGLFLVRYSIEAGLIGPGVRVMLGALLSAGLIAAGEWMRRGEYAIPIETLPKAHIPSVLTAAGTITAFATIYAAHALYGFLGSASAFVLLGATGILTMLASALHGPALAGLGLAGAFATPLLVSSTTPSYWSLVLYLAVVAAAAYALARTRGWLWLAMSAVTGATLWGLALLAEAAGPLTVDTLTLTNATLVHILVQLGLAAFFMAYEPHLARRDEAAEPDPIASGALAAMTFLIAAFLVAVSFSYWGWIPAATVAIVILTAMGWLAAPAAGAVLLAGAAALVALSQWPGLDLPPDRTLLAPYAARLLRLPENVSQYLAWSAWWTVPPAVIAAYRIWRGSLLPLPAAGLYALAATVPPLLAAILAYLRVTQFDTSISFAFAGVALAAANAFAADRFQKADHAYTVPAYRLAAGAFASAAIAGLSFALVVSLSRGYLTVALALTALGTAYVSTLRDIPLLRHVVSALGILVVLRIAWDPRIMGDGVGTTPLFNWLLIGYGVPALSFWQSARLLERQGEDLSVRISDALAVVFAALLAFFEIRHLTNNGDVLHGDTSHVEAGLMTLVAILMSFVLARMNLAKKNPVFDAASMIIGAGAIAFATFDLAIGTNPYITGDAVGGGTVFSTLLVGYLLPGLAALYVARHARGSRPEWYTRAAGILAVGLIFSYVTLETRHAFQGPLIGRWNATSDAESWALSVVWLLLGIGFLAYGLLRRSLEARIASAALVILAALKVTLYDLSGIGGIWRALSFICLGAVLIGIGLVYQKLVFTERQPD